MSGSLLALPGIALTGAAGFGVLKLATADFVDALQAESVDDFNEATKNMAPTAVAAARAIRDQTTRLDELKKIVQGKFFAGFDSDVRGLADRYFPILNKQGGAIAEQLNKMGRASAAALMAPEAVDDVNTILGATKDTLKELEPAAGNVLAALLDLGGAGAGSSVRLGKAITSLTEDFRRWVAQGVKTGEINHLIEEGIDTAKDFGRVLQNVGQIGLKLWSGLSAGEEDFLSGIIKTTQAVEDFLDSAEGQAALKELGSTLRVTADVARNILGTALTQLGPIIRDAGPGIRAIVEGIGEFLTNAIETVGPLLHGLVFVLSENKDVVEDLVPVVLGLVVAYKGLKIATEVKTWMAGIPGLFGDIETKANAAGAAIGDEKGKGGLVGRLGGLRAVAGTVALAAVAKGLDEVNVSAAGSEEKLGPVEETLHNIVSAGEAILSLDFSGVFTDLKSELDEVASKFKDGQSPLGKLIMGEKGKIGFEITAGADISQAREDLRNLTDEIGRSQATVKVNGNTVPAATALKTVIDAIERGEGTVNINGANIDAHRALDDIIGLINASSGTIKVDGNEVPAGQVLLGLLNRVNGSRAQMHIDAETSGAQGVIDSFIRRNDGRTVQIFTSVLGAGGIASAGRLATGGRPYFDGKVTGPGSRTNDRAGLFALSRDEHVWNAREVAAAGGHLAMYRMRQAVLNGAFRGFADGGTPRYLNASLATAGSRSSGSLRIEAPQVRVFIGEREITDVVRTEISHAQRQSDRRASTGPGGAW
ncbi:MAG: hypothetical protein HOQ21_09810 [Dermatophilaceae bacterium]|nr:hypothetical protein [Dermatophilaceae bacterium]